GDAVVRECGSGVLGHGDGGCGVGGGILVRSGNRRGTRGGVVDWRGLVVEPTGGGLGSLVLRDLDLFLFLALGGDLGVQLGCLLADQRQYAVDGVYAQLHGGRYVVGLVVLVGAHVDVVGLGPAVDPE